MADRRRPSEAPAGSPNVFLPNGEAIRALARELAPLVAAHLAEEMATSVSSSSRPPMTAREVMVRLGRSYDFVRDHRHELGVLEVAGERPRLLFDPAAVERFSATALDGEVRSRPADSSTGTGVSRRRRAPRLGTAVDLLPVQGRDAASRESSCR